MQNRLCAHIYSRAILYGTAKKTPTRKGAMQPCWPDLPPDGPVHAPRMPIYRLVSRFFYQLRYITNVGEARDLQEIWNVASFCADNRNFQNT